MLPLLLWLPVCVNDLKYCGCYCCLPQVEEVFDMHKEEGIMAVVNTIGDYVRMPMSGATSDQMMKVLQVRA
jgi:hypothetical protein